MFFYNFIIKKTDYMNLNREALRTPYLTHLEAGQLIKQHLTDLKTIDPTLLTDVPFNNYLQTLSQSFDQYLKAVAQVSKNMETEKVSQADDKRDKAVDAFGKALKLYAVSDEPREVEASRVLEILFSVYKNLATINYESESLSIDKLVSELEKSSYSDYINLLQMNRYVTRLKNTNEAFKTLFRNRMVTTAMTETYDMKSIRSEMFKKYSEFTFYVLSMAKALNTPLFTDSLKLLNTERKYYSDMLSRRIKKEDDQEKPTQ